MGEAGESGRVSSCSRIRPANVPVLIYSKQVETQEERWSIAKVR